MKKERWSCAWTMQALAAVINLPIVSLYPRLVINGSADKIAGTQNRQFLPLHGCAQCVILSIYIIWSHTSLYQTTRKRKIWTPNHFVPMIKSLVLPVKALTPNTSSVRDPDLTPPIKKKIAQKNINSSNNSNFAIP